MARRAAILWAFSLTLSFSCVAAWCSSLKGVRLNAWNAYLWNIHEWHRERVAARTEGPTP